MDTGAFFRKSYLAQCSRYWKNGQELLSCLPLKQTKLASDTQYPPRVFMVQVPDWAADLSVRGYLAVPKNLIEAPYTWENVDWPLIGAWYINCLAERNFEDLNGPIHSYSLRLKGWDERIWSHAWANRIALFLRRWTAKIIDRSEEELFGPLPETKILLTHDVDAINKTIPIRLKQSAFNFFNVMRQIMYGNGEKSLRSFYSAIRFFCGSGRGWDVEEIVRLNEFRGLKALFLFPGRKPSTFLQFKRWLFDPGYDISSISTWINTLTEKGHSIGLHPSYEDWKDCGRIQESRHRLQKVLDQQVDFVRQHWLRFSFRDTWINQRAAGLKNDCTLGFNDRYGFRNGAALAMSPLNPARNGLIDNFKSWPLILMDSHLYDYRAMTEEERYDAIEAVINEVRAVHGQATVLWHPHTLSNDYGWKEGFSTLLQVLAGHSRFS